LNPNRFPTLALGLLFFAAFGCVGRIESMDGRPERSPASTGGVGGNAAGRDGNDPANGGMAGHQPAPRDVAASPLRRLTRTQYANTVRDLLNLDNSGADGLSPDEKNGGFFSNAAVNLAEIQVDQYQRSAERIADRATQNLKDLVPCAPADADTTSPMSTEANDCVVRFVQGFGRRAYRRPLTTDESARFNALFVKTQTQDGFRSGIALIVQAMLLSPHFLHLVETGDGTTVEGRLVPLTSHERAARLSYFLWNSMPDAELAAAADSGSLSNETQIAVQAERLLASPKARDSIASFHEQWLQTTSLVTVEKSKVLFPEFDDVLRSAMREETVRFADQVIRVEDGRLANLLTSDYSLLSGPLYPLYGLPPGGPGWQRATFSHPRSGIFMHASGLAVHSHADQTSLVQRGLVIRQRLLCSTPPPPPPTVDDTPPMVDRTQSARTRFAQHRANPSCANCHRMMDPLGAPFEIFDPIGRFRTVDGIEPVDASGELFGTDSDDGPVAGPVELMLKLAATPEVQDCIVRQWFRFAVGRQEGDADQRSLDQSMDAFREKDFRIRDLLIGLTLTDAFLNRRPGGMQ
jgi:Protein of unknown function (DUF1592)/Protein of unknown function (DUF1588)/Protein of unknown function (DUF1595)/Protein of unknown function (DUF1587)/Protein of unknown function (DUF1585)